MANSKKKRLVRIPFQGPTNTEIEKSMLPSGTFSWKQNTREMNPGLKQRKGVKRQHTTTDTAQEVKRLFQYEDAATTKYLYSQRADGSVHVASNNPPTQTTGDFGTQALATVTGASTATSAITRDMLFYADGARQIQVYSGTQQRIKAFIVYKGAAAIPVIPEIGEDYTQEVTDSRTTRVAILDSLNTLANYDAIYVITDTPCTGLKWTIGAANGNSATMTVKYWNGAYTSVSGFSDGTASGGATLAQNGTMSWTQPSDEIPYFQFGLSGYCYQLSVSAALDAEVEIVEVNYNSAWTDVENIWDGVTADAIEAQVYFDDHARYYKYGGVGIDASSCFVDATNDRIYFSSPYKLFGIHVDVGNTPNIRKAVYVGSSNVNFDASGSYIELEDASWYEYDFEEGMDIDVTGTTNNNHTWTIKRLTSYRAYVEGSNAVEDETNQSATITYDDNQSATVNQVEGWDGDSWAAVSGLDDGSLGLSQSGYIMWTRPTTLHKTDFNQSGYYAYWYSLRVSAQTSRNVSFSIRCLPYFAQDDFGNGQTVASWKGRLSTSYDKWGKYVYISTYDAPLSFNGNDYAIIEVGDGRENKILAQAQYHNDLMVWQEEKGEDGGCTTIIEGYDPATFGIYLLSPRVGIVNGKSYALVDGLEIGTQTYTRRQQLAFWISRYGVFVSDGTSVQSISDLKDRNGGSIDNYFDPADSNCLTKGQEDKHWMTYDSANNCLRLGLVTGSGSTQCNLFPVFDLDGWVWSFDVIEPYLSCMTEIEANSGATDVAMMGGDYNGFVYLGNTGSNDYASNGTAVTTSGVDLAFATSTTITRATGSFVTDGWTVGMGVHISGSAANDTSTGSVEQLTTVAATTLTFSGASFATAAAASGITLTNENPIDCYADIDVDGEGHEVMLNGGVLRCKSQAAGNVTFSQGRHGATPTEISKNFSMVDSNGRARIKFIQDQQSDHFTWRFRNNTASQELYLLDLALDIDVRDDYV